MLLIKTNNARGVSRRFVAETPKIIIKQGVKYTQDLLSIITLKIRIAVNLIRDTRYYLLISTTGILTLLWSLFAVYTIYGHVTMGAY